MTVTTLGIVWTDIQSYLEANGVKAGLARRGEGVQDVDTMNDTPGPMYIISRSVRPGWLTEERSAQWASFQIRAIGDQNNYDYAETLAFQIDAILVGVDVAVTMGTVRVSGVQDLGGGPTLLTKDTSGRSHFTASYAFAVPSGLA